jgi:signal peptidase I
MIFVKRTVPEEVKTGDIITFNPDSNSKDGQSATTLTHRVVAVLDQLNGDPGPYFITKGDHNNSNDPPIPGSALIGVKVFHLPKVGKLLVIAQKHLALTIAFCAALMVLIFALFYFFSKDEFNTKRKTKGKPKKSQLLPPMVE